MMALGEKDISDILPYTSPVVSDSTVATALPWRTQKPGYLVPFFIIRSVISRALYNPELGSSWAVSGKKSKSGFPF